MAAAAPGHGPGPHNHQDHFPNKNRDEWSTDEFKKKKLNGARNTVRPNSVKDWGNLSSYDFRPFGPIEIPFTLISNQFYVILGWVGVGWGNPYWILIESLFARGPEAHPGLLKERVRRTIEFKQVSGEGCSSPLPPPLGRGFNCISHPKKIHTQRHTNTHAHTQTHTHTHTHTLPLPPHPQIIVSFYFFGLKRLPSARKPPILEFSFVTKYVWKYVGEISRNK